MTDTPETVLKHRHAPEDLLRVFQRAGCHIGVLFKCGCTATYAADGKALTGGGNIPDMPQAELLSRLNTRTPSFATPEVSELVERLCNRVKIETACGNRTENRSNHVRLMDEAATTLETLEVRVKVLEEALERCKEEAGDGNWSNVIDIADAALLK